MSLTSLDAEHQASFKHAMANLLSTPIAEFTYAQIVDGMPISNIYKEDHRFCEGFPVLDHKDLCPGTMDKTRAFRSQFDIDSVEFEPKLLQAYQNTSPGSIAYKLRLLEMVVIACHNIAVLLYQLDDGTHKHAEWEDWLTKELALTSEGEDQYMHITYGPPTSFYVGLYVDFDRYPNGLADVVGYWAEHHIFGGVVLFDRGRDEEECNGIYLHNPKSASTIAPPTERQFSDLLDFLLSPSPSPQIDTSLCPLPIRITLENKWRWHDYRGKADHHIFKFRHEIPREPPFRDHCVINPKDWPEYGDWALIEEETMKPLDGGVCDAVLVAAAMERMRQISTPTSRCYAWEEEEMARRQPDPKRRGRPPYFFDP